LRAFWAATIAFCLLVVGGRPVETRVHERETVRLDVAVHSTAASAIRRSSPLDAQLRPLFLAPSAAPVLDAPPRAAYILEAITVPRWHHQLVEPTRSSRGPPQA
jgi:hypothetical protein